MDLDAKVHGVPIYVFTFIFMKGTWSLIFECKGTRSAKAMELEERCDPEETKGEGAKRE